MISIYKMPVAYKDHLVLQHVWLGVPCPHTVSKQPYFLKGDPKMGPRRVCLHIFVVELYSLILYCREESVRVQFWPVSYVFVGRHLACGHTAVVFHLKCSSANALCIHPLAVILKLHILSTYSYHTYLSVDKQDEGLCSEGWVPGHRQGDSTLLHTIRGQQSQVVNAALGEIILHLSAKYACNQPQQDSSVE